jgi:hypothetical protein
VRAERLAALPGHIGLVDGEDAERNEQSHAQDDEGKPLHGGA